MKSDIKRRMRTAARLYAVQALFQMEQSGQSAEAVTEEFLEHRFGGLIDGEELSDGDPKLFTKLVAEAVNWQAKVDQMADRGLVAKWPIARIDPTLRALFRAAGAELVATDTPPKVIISEFVSVSNAFSTDSNETAFVNAVLDHMAHEAHPDGF
jgi:N utilization substance protein B